MTTTYEQIKTIISDNYLAELAGYTRYSMILNLLKKFEGKPITKHLSTHVAKQYPKEHVYLSTLYGMYHLKMSNSETKIEYSFLLGYDSNREYTAEKFAKHNTCYGSAALERNKLRMGLLDNDKQEFLQEMADNIDKRNESMAALEKLSGLDIPDIYAIRKIDKVQEAQQLQQIWSKSKC